jgi:hypothetical protein
MKIDYRQLVHEVVSSSIIDELTASDPTNYSIKAIQRLRKKYSAEFVSLALHIAESRNRSNRKFPDSEKLCFTPELLEQATAHPVAMHRAELLSGFGKILDLGCAAGGDLTRFALAGSQVIGLERDELPAALAEHNLTQLGLSGEVINAEFPCELPDFDVLFVDPQRREKGRGPSGSKRRWDPAEFSPRPKDLRPLLNCKAWAIKWGPGLDLDYQTMTAEGALLEGMSRDDYELQVVSWNGQVREALFIGGEAKQSNLTAVVITGPTDDYKVHKFISNEIAAPKVTEPADYLYDPDGTLLRTNLLNSFASENGMNIVAEDIAYLTSEVKVDSPFLTRFKRLASIEMSLPKLQAALNELDAGSVIIRKRGYPEEPEEIRKRLSLAGTAELTVLLHRSGNKHIAHICEKET